MYSVVCYFWWNQSFLFLHRWSLRGYFPMKYFPFCRDSWVVAVGRHFRFLLILCGGRCYSCYCVFFCAFFEGVIFLYLQFADDEAMITWCFCSIETSSIHESVLGFLAAGYVVDLIIHRYCFLQIFGINAFAFSCRYVGSFVFKCCVADEKVVDCAQKSMRCCPLLFQRPRAKFLMQLSLTCCLIFFPALAFQSPVKIASDLFLTSLRTVLISF